MTKTTLDIHNTKSRLEQARTRFWKRFRPENAEVVCDFLDRLRLENKSHGRIANYAECCQRILQIRDDKNISEWTKKEIEAIHKTIADADYENSTKKDTLTALKRLYHYAKHDEIADKSKDRDYDPNVSWISPGSFHNKYETIQAKDLLTDEEILNLIQAVKKIGGKYVKRNIAMLFCLFEGSYRPGELLAIKMDGVTFNTDFVRVHTTGKTGPKLLALVASFVTLKEWIAEHPKSDEPDAYLWFHDNKAGVITYLQFYNLIAKSRKIAGIKKRIWPYLFRHSSLTYYSKRLGNVAKLYGNWSHSSHMLSRYEHLASSDQEDAILKLYGLKKEDDSNSILFSKICSSCKERNSADKSHCIKCGVILSKDLAQEREVKKLNKSRRIEKNFSLTITELQKAILEQQRKLDELLKEIN